MLLPHWLRSPTRGGGGGYSRVDGGRSTTSSPSHSPRFSCSSFKDIQNLVTQEDPDEPKRVLKTSILRRLWPHHHRHPLHHSIFFKTPNDNTNTIILYFTTLRVVRTTFDDCRAVRSILQGYGVAIDERDVWMDADYLEELQEIVGPKPKPLRLPVLMVGGKCFSGAAEITRMHETGELKKIIDGKQINRQQQQQQQQQQPIPINNNHTQYGNYGNMNGNGCHVCGGLRFAVCQLCSGSHKIHNPNSGFISCTACNLNGLIRCPSCSPMLRRRTSA